MGLYIAGCLRAGKPGINGGRAAGSVATLLRFDGIFVTLFENFENKSRYFARPTPSTTMGAYLPTGRYLFPFPPLPSTRPLPLVVPYPFVPFPPSPSCREAVLLKPARWSEGTMYEYASPVRSRATSVCVGLQAYSD